LALATQSGQIDGNEVTLKPSKRDENLLNSVEKILAEVKRQEGMNFGVSSGKKVQ
jgi:hypothetical protein